MYRLTNLTLDKSTTYRNKDLVYQALERENAKVKHQEAECLLLVEELDKKGVVIYQEDIYLPFEGIADSLFLKGSFTSAETSTKKKDFLFMKYPKNVSNQESSKNEKQELRKPLSDTKYSLEGSRKNFSFLWFLLLLFFLIGFLSSLALASFTTNLAIKQSKELSSLNQQVEKLENLQLESGKIDTFTRYFLSHYYSEQGLLDDFHITSLELNNQSEQLQSVILESCMQIDKQTYQMTYVVSIKDGDNTRQNRITVMVENSPSSTYGYQVISEPKLSDYPK